MAFGHSRLVRLPVILSAVLAVFALAASATFGDRFNFDGFSQLALQRYGSRTQQIASQWHDLVNASRSLPEAERTRKINDFFNRRIVYKEDSEIWGRSDYWATLLETLGRGEGDCEDFAIAKYFSLLLAGVPADRLRITYVKARIGGQYSNVSIAHMVLGYYPGPNDEPMILDNLLDDIRPASRRPDLTPVFTFNSEGLWAGGAANAASAGSATARLSRWRDLISRMQADGFE